MYMQDLVIRILESLFNKVLSFLVLRKQMQFWIAAVCSWTKNEMKSNTLTCSDFPKSRLSR